MALLESVPRRLVYDPAMKVDEVTAKRLDRTVWELRERGLSYPAIQVVLDLYHGIELTEEEVRGWLHRLGEPKNPRKSRARAAA